MRIFSADSVLLGSTSAVSGWQYSCSTNETNTQIWAASARSYAVKVTNPSLALHCFVDKDTVVIDTFPTVVAPLNIAGNDTLFCRGNTMTLGVGGWGAGWLYFWNPPNWLNNPFIPKE